jgi:TetR/AcrR family transcriptional regulator
VFSEPGRLRPIFIKEVAARMLPMLVALIERGRASGKFRADLDPNLAALSLLSLCMFPFISRAVTVPVMGLGLTGEPLARLVEHTARVYLHGICAPTMEQRP